MAASILLSDTVNFCKPFVNWANITIGTNNEPFISSANLTLQTIVGPPFAWAWNRTKTNFLTTQGTQDYATSLSAFGYLEAASIQLGAVITSVTVSGGIATFTAINNFSSLLSNGSVPTQISGCTTSALNGSQTITSATPTTFTCSIATSNVTESESGAKALAGPIMPLELKSLAITDASEQDRPSFISTQSSDESGVNLTWRLLPVPNTTYQVNLIYQLAPPLVSSLSSTWGIPNDMQYIYSYFMLFLVLDYFDDVRAARYRQLAVASLLARAEGLNEQDRNMFLGNWLPLVAQEANNSLSTQQGSQARGI